MPSFEQWIRLAPSEDASRSLEFHALDRDTYLIVDGGEVSLSDRATLMSLLGQLTRKEDT